MSQNCDFLLFQLVFKTIEVLDTIFSKSIKFERLIIYFYKFIFLIFKNRWEINLEES